MQANDVGVVLDLDGTLVDSRADIANAANAAMEAVGLLCLDPSMIAGFVGDGARALVQRCLEHQQATELLDEAFTQFCSEYERAVCVCTRPYPRVVETLLVLQSQGYRIALCTNKPREMTVPLLAQLELAGFFETLACGEDLERKKPDPLPLRTIAQRLQLQTERLVMVGYSPQDVQAGKAAGARTVGVTYGIGSLESVRALAPDALIDSFQELPPTIERLLGKQ